MGATPAPSPRRSEMREMREAVGRKKYKKIRERREVPRL
jgi:hypothetical protein